MLLISRRVVLVGLLLASLALGLVSPVEAQSPRFRTPGPSYRWPFRPPATVPCNYGYGYFPTRWRRFEGEETWTDTTYEGPANAQPTPAAEELPPAALPSDAPLREEDNPPLPPINEPEYPSGEMPQAPLDLPPRDPQRAPLELPEAIPAEPGAGLPTEAPPPSTLPSNEGAIESETEMPEPPPTEPESGPTHRSAYEGGPRFSRTAPPAPREEDGWQRRSNVSPSDRSAAASVRPPQAPRRATTPAPMAVRIAPAREEAPVKRASFDAPPASEVPPADSAHWAPSSRSRPAQGAQGSLERISPAEPNRLASPPKQRLRENPLRAADAAAEGEGNSGPANLRRNPLR